MRHPHIISHTDLAHYLFFRHRAAPFYFELAEIEERRGAEGPRAPFPPAQSKVIPPRGKTRAGDFRLAVGWFQRKRYGGIVKITEEGRREHHMGNATCPACDSPDGQHWPQPHRDGIVVKDCLGLVHCEEVPTPNAPGASSVVYRCDLCGDTI